MFGLLERCFAYAARFAIAARNLGLHNAFTVFHAIRGGSELRSIFVSGPGLRIFFRSAADKGAISHFFYPNVRIVDSPQHPVRVIVDAGANIGIETIRMLHFHPHARLLAVEADAQNFEVLTRNAEPFKQRVELLKKGIWSSDAFLKVVPGTTNESFSVRPVEAGESADLEAVTMHTILERVGGEIDILKMDIEGAEFEVFANKPEWVAHVKVFIIECPDRDHAGATAKIFDALRGLPFNTYISGENLVLIRQDIGWDYQSTPYL